MYIFFISTSCSPGTYIPIQLKLVWQLNPASGYPGGLYKSYRCDAGAPGSAMGCLLMGQSVNLAPLLPHTWTQWLYLGTAVRTRLVIGLPVNQADVALFLHRKFGSDGSILWDASLTVLNRQAKMTSNLSAEEEIINQVLIRIKERFEIVLEEVAYG